VFGHRRMGRIGQTNWSGGKIGSILKATWQPRGWGALGEASWGYLTCWKKAGEDLPDRRCNWQGVNQGIDRVGRTRVNGPKVIGEEDNFVGDR